MTTKTHLLCLNTCLHIRAIASLVMPNAIEDEEALGSLDKSAEEASRAFLKYSFCLRENRVSAEVTAKTTSLTENIAGLGNSFARCRDQGILVFARQANQE